MRDRIEGWASLPVAADQPRASSSARSLIRGSVTLGDCRWIRSQGTLIERCISVDPMTCRDGGNVEQCECAKQERQLRRIHVVDLKGHALELCPRPNWL